MRRLNFWTPLKNLRAWPIFVVVTVFALSSCEIESYGENVEQNYRTALLNKTLVDLKKNGATQLPEKLNWLTNYASACRNAKPRIPHENCLQLIIEGISMSSAKYDVMQTAKLIQSVTSKQSDPSLEGVYVVIFPAVREREYTGDVTPYSISKYFKTGDPMIVKIGG